jgi:hypothetical protein
MTLRTRIALAIIGAILVILAVLALAYALAPAGGGTVQEQYRPAPTWFAPPADEGGAP